MRNEQTLLLRPKDVSQVLGLGRDKVYRLIHTGKLRSIRVGSHYRIPRTELECFLERELENQ